jgi:hypothetical protein
LRKLGCKIKYNNSEKSYKKKYNWFMTPLDKLIITSQSDRFTYFGSWMLKLSVSSNKSICGSQIDLRIIKGATPYKAPEGCEEVALLSYSSSPLSSLSYR